MKLKFKKKWFFLKKKKMNIKFYIFHCDNIKAIINPYNPNASAKISIKIIPTNIFS